MENTALDRTQQLGFKVVFFSELLEHCNDLQLSGDGLTGACLFALDLASELKQIGTDLQNQCA